MKDKAVEESGNTKDSVYASLTQSKEELASMVISDAETGRLSVRCIRGLRLIASENLKVLTASRHSLVRQHRQQEHKEDSTPINTAHTAQYSLFTSAERIAHAWLKNCITSLCV